MLEFGDTMRGLLLLGLVLLQTDAPEARRVEREQAVDRAKRALADTIEIGDGEVELVSVHESAWPDTRLGCPGGEDEPYRVERVQGFRVLLRMDDAVYRVHLGGEEARVCGAPLRVVESPRPASEPEAAPKPTEKMFETLVASAKQDLARRLAVDPGTIEVVEARAVVWPNAALGCPRPGLEYLQVQQEGALVRLRVLERTFSYHSGGGRAPFLCENEP